MELKKTFINLETGKEWHIEVAGHQVRSRLGNGRIKENVYDSDYDTENKSAQEIMAKMRKGFIYQNADVSFGEAQFHTFVGKSYTGFMPIGASVMKDDFYITRVVGNFEDELLLARCFALMVHCC